MQKTIPSDMPMDSVTGKSIRDIMSGPPVTIPATATLSDAAQQMESLCISCIFVEDEQEIVGIMTERDVIRALNASLDLGSPVEAVMSRAVIHVEDSAELHEAYHVMVVNNIRHLLVVDQTNNPVGVLTESDFRKRRGVEAFVGALDVSNVMSQNYIELPGTATTLQASNQMQLRAASCVIVTSDAKPVGILTERDMVRLYRRQMADSSLESVMNQPVQAIAADSLLFDAANRMHQLGLRRLVVIDASGRLIGVLNEHDMIRHMESEYILMLKHLVIQQAHELNEDRFRTLVNHLPQKICVKDIDSAYLACNHSYAADLNIAPDQIVGKPTLTSSRKTLPENIRQMTGWLSSKGK